MKKKVILLLAVVVLAAGTAAFVHLRTNQKTVCTGNINGQEVSVALTHNKDKLKRQTIEKSTSFEILGEGITSSEVEKLAQEQEKIYQNIPGISYSYEVSGDTVIERLTIDFQKADIALLEEYGIVEGNSVTGEEENKTVSYEATLRGYKAVNIVPEE